MMMRVSQSSSLLLIWKWSINQSAVYTFIPIKDNNQFRSLDGYITGICRLNLHLYLEIKSLMAQLVESCRGGKALHYEYIKIRDGKEGNTFCRCQLHKSGCNGRGTSEGCCVIVRNEHNHTPAPTIHQKDKTVAKMSKRDIEYMMKHCRKFHRRWQ